MRYFKNRSTPGLVGYFPLRDAKKRMKEGITKKMLKPVYFKKFGSRNALVSKKFVNQTSNSCKGV